MSNPSWQTFIGLEIHAQLLTHTKLFSSDGASFSEKANTHIHPVSLALPGVLPVLNVKALEYAIRTGLAFNCHINKKNIFARKNYFYPDLPKGYQISQHDMPLCEKGYVEFECEGQRQKVRIRRVHIEEDAGGLRHKAYSSLVNFNRAGVALIEIVTEPDIRSPRSAASLARMVRDILRYINVCDGSLEEGSLRCDCNVSVKKSHDSSLGVRTELKNINSFKFIEKALNYEVKRHISLLSEGQTLTTQTRLYDSAKNKTFAMRSKETAGDYRYFPDPDLLPVVLTKDEIESQKKHIPELPIQKWDRFQKEYHLSSAHATILVQQKELAQYFEQLVKIVPKSSHLAVNWLINELLAVLNESKISLTKSPVSPQQLGKMIQFIEQKILSGKMAKKVFAQMWKTGKDCELIVNQLNIKRISDDKTLIAMILDIINQYPQQVEEYKKGKKKLFGFFIGKIMAQSRGQADPEKLSTLLKQKLDSGL